MCISYKERGLELLEQSRLEEMQSLATGNLESLEISCFANSPSVYMLCSVYCLREMEHIECVRKETARTGRM